MLQTPKVLHPSPQSLLPPPPPPPPQIQNLPTSQPPLSLKQHLHFSRRELAVSTASSLLLLGPQTLASSKAQAEETSQEQEQVSPPATCIDFTPTKKAFIDVSINGEPAGRIIIGLYGKAAPAGSSRFTDIVSGAAGVSYRRKEFIKITPNYVQHGGLRSFGVDAELAKNTGTVSAIDNLKNEWANEKGKCSGTRNVEGSVGIIVRNPYKPPPKVKLVAKNGKLQVDEEEVGVDPNGTEFVISMRDSPELDESALVIGKVLEGMDVVRKIGEVTTVQDNTGSPYFRVAKLIGDKRAVVAERGFNRPYSKVVVSNCGLLE